MAIKTIITEPNKILRQVSISVENVGKEVINSNNIELIKISNNEL